MKLQGIREDILNVFSDLTIDDLYSNSIENLVANKFTQLTNLSTKDEIRKFLTQKFPESTLEMVSFTLNSNIKSSEEKINSLVAEIQTKNNLILKYENEIIKNNTFIKENSEIQSSFRKVIKDIENEMSQILPLAEKGDYADKLRQLKKDKEFKSEKIESLVLESLNLNNEIEVVNEKIQDEKFAIEQFENEILLLNKTIFKINEKLNEENNIDEQFYKEEYASLEFLFKLFLQEQIKTREEFVSQLTGEKTYDYYFKDTKEWVKTGKLELNYYGLNKDYFGFITNLVEHKNVIPEKWRAALLKNLSSAIPKLSGEIIKTNDYNTSCYQRKDISLDYVDLSILLALKIALEHNYSIKTDNNEIVLGLSGGILAKISFRDKGKQIGKFQQKDFEIFANCLHTERQEFHTLYHQTGYADSEIKIKTPGSFTFLIEGFVVDIVFEPAPILFENSNLARISPNIAGKAKLDDEYDDDY